jgi:hypothetical protein
MKHRKKGYGWMMVLTVLFTLAAISTLLPQAEASKACLLGYYAHCSFTPISTLICIALAAISCIIRKRKYVTIVE